MADQIRATPRSPILGLFSDLVNLPLQYMSAPERTQQSQGVAQFLYGTGIPKTLERASYGDSLFSGAGGLGGTTRMRPETSEALLNVAPFAPVAGRVAGRMIKATEGMPVGMSIKPINLNKGIYKPELTMEEMLKVKDIPTVDRVKQSIDLVGEKEFEKMVNTQYKKYKPSDQDQEAMLVESVTLDILGKAQRSPYPQQAALNLAQQRAAQTGQSLEAYPRSLQQGYEHDWYHGSTGDIYNFRQDLLGETTGAQSAKKGFFFARDPQNPPASMMVKTTDPASIDLLKKLGKTDEEIAALNQVSMKGQGAETASGYAQIGGSREYKEAMRRANEAEKGGDWQEYEKQMQIAEDSEINRMNYAQNMVAKYGDARDEMLDTIQKTIYGKNLPQAEAEVLDKKYMELMPYGWYNSFDTSQFNTLKKKLVDLVGEDAATPALKQIDNFKSVKAERMSVENTQEGGNVLPVALRYKNPMVYDFGGASYREQTYSDLVDQALRGGHDALILKNTFDPASGQAKLIDVGVVFSPDQIRSRFAAFDPFRKDVATAAAMGVAAPNLLAQPVNQEQPSYETFPMYTDPFGNTIGSSIR